MTVLIALKFNSTSIENITLSKNGIMMSHASNQVLLTIWWGWSGGAKVLGKLPVSGRPANLDEVGQGPIELAVGAGGGCLDFFSLVYHFSFLSPSLWETA